MDILTWFGPTKKPLAKGAFVIYAGSTGPIEGGFGLASP